VGAAPQVLLGRQVLEDLPPLHNLEDPLPYDLLGILPVDLFAAEEDLPVGDLPLLGLEEPGDGLEGGALPRPVGAQQRDDLPSGTTMESPLRTRMTSE